MKFVRHKVKFVRHLMKFVRHKVKLRGRSHAKVIIKRDPMISVGFKRVSQTRPCRICGKPTYCGFSRDEGTSICMRISAGSRGLSRNGGNIHVHPEIPFITIRPTIKRPISQSVPPAPVGTYSEEHFPHPRQCLLFRVVFHMRQRIPFRVDFQ